MVFLDLSMTSGMATTVVSLELLPIFLKALHTANYTKYIILMLHPHEKVSSLMIERPS